MLNFLIPVFAKKVSEENYPQEKDEDSESFETTNEELDIKPEAIIHYVESPEPTLLVVNQKEKKTFLLSNQIYCNRNSQKRLLILTKMTTQNFY